MLNFLSWLFGHHYSSWSAALNGRIDGQKGIPDCNQTLQPPYIMQLKNSAEGAIDRLRQEWEKRDARLLAAFCQAKQRVEAFTHALEKAERDFQKARADEQRARDEHIKHFDMPPFSYWAVLFFVSLAEFYLNSVVFRLFGDKEWVTFLVSLGIGIIFPLCAHLLGGMLAHGILKDGRFSTRTVKIILLILIPLASVAAIAVLREKFFEASGVQDVLKIQMEYSTVTAVFFILNLLIYFGMTAAAFVSHDPTNVKYRTDLRIAMRLRKNAEHRIKINEHGRERALHQQQEIEALRLKEFERAKNETKEWRDTAQRLMSVYHAHNMRARSDGATMPECFKKYPPIDVPKEIEPGNDYLSPGQLSWDCASVRRDFNSVETLKQVESAPDAVQPKTLDEKATADGSSVKVSRGQEVSTNSISTAETKIL
jgi:hypothetical protein